MITVQVNDKKFWDTMAEGYGFLVTEDLDASQDLKQLEEKFQPQLRAILKKHKFEGKKGQSLVLSQAHEGQLYHSIFIGLGTLKGHWETELETLRRGVGRLTHLIKKHELEHAVLEVPSAKQFGVSPEELVEQITTTMVLADYQFDTYKTKKDKAPDATVLLAADEGSMDELKERVSRGMIIGQSANVTRHLADLPPNAATPSFVADEAEKIAKEHGFKYTVFGREKAAELGMGGFMAVDAGSDQDGRFVILEYDAPDKNAPTIALVGKGVTFDSGGLSLKPASYMTGMKYDMSGAASVLGTFRALAQLKPNVNVVGLMPLVENLPSGKSSKQDEIVTFYNGKTAEIENTDAEGRLILADALAYAEKHYNPAVIIDIATLTGACVAALGHHYTALMTDDEELGTRLKESGARSGDKLWHLPLPDDYKEAIKSPVADLSNTGRRDWGAGTITAGLFLGNFIEKTPWAHLDIAGTADGVNGVNYLGKGATGVGVRLFVDFVMNYDK